MSQGVAILIARYCLLDQLMQSRMPCNKGLGLFRRLTQLAWIVRDISQ